MDITAKEVVGMGIGASVVGTIWGHLSSLPKFIWNKGRQATITTIEIPQVDEYNSKEIITYIELWMSENNKKTHRYLKASVDYNDQKEKDVIILTPDVVYNPGWFKYKGKRLLINAWKRESQVGKVFFDYTLTFFTRDASIAKEFLDMVEKNHRDKFDKDVTCKVWRQGEWNDSKDINPRSFDSVILPTEQKEALLKDIDTFIERKQLYQDLSIIHKRGYLFEGLPGTGKSTLANAIAYYLKWNLYSFSPSSVSSGQNLDAAFSNIKPKSVVLLEDIDTYNISRVEGKEGGNAGEWLNWLDGINSPNDVIFVITTNYVDRLDSALIRDGRVDYSMNFTYATKEQIYDSYLRFNPNANHESAVAFVNEFEDKPAVMADIQNKLFRALVPAWRGLSNNE